MKFCSNCGQPADNTRFCSNCGQPIGGAPSQQLQAPPPQEDQEQTLWEGEAKDLSNLASGGRIARAKYRLTNRTLYFQQGVISTSSEQVPLWAVRDLDMRQSITQRVRGVGTIVVHVEHSDYTGRKEVVLDDIENPGRVRDLLNQSAQRERYTYEQRKQTRYFGR